MIALSMWRVAFTGENDFGLGFGHRDVLLFLLVVPILLLNIRRS